MAIRISTGEVAQTALNGIETSYDQFSAAESQLSSGKQLNEPSDNPAGTAQLLALNAQISELNQYGSTISQATNFASSTESALATVTTLVQQARSIAVQAANGTPGTQTDSALTSQVQDIIQQIGQIGNTTDGQQYVFAGQRTNTPPFVPNNGGFNYVGGSATTGDGNISLSIAQSETVTVNVPGDTTLVPILNVLTTLRDDISLGATQNISKNDLSAIDTQLNNIEGVSANFGSLINRMNATTQQNALTIQNFTQFVSNIQDTNVASAAVQLQTAQTAYQAALDATSKVFQYSLLNFLH